ncbi:hypothetical protein LSUE1_G002885 [Lachnellula suecica]|uniref:Large ribosomal subunit protein bL33m n=1 Tax=Lachnellula suecica TaxID=602035 RepID=A0A8T9CGL0_9HELO|nr:hypothetical protein LSUE1_G002885 [Lachnellula suecica]
MAKKPKSRTIAVRLVSMALTGYYKTLMRPRTHRPLSMLKYDPVALGWRRVEGEGEEASLVLMASRAGVGRIEWAHDGVGVGSTKEGVIPGAEARRKELLKTSIHNERSAPNWEKASSQSATLENAVLLKGCKITQC